MNKPLLISIFLLSLYCGAIFSYQNLWPLWLEHPKSHNGRGYEAWDVSLLLLISGFLIVVINYTVLWRVHKIKSRTVFTVSVLVVIVFYSCLPCLLPIESNLLFMVCFVICHIILLAFFNLITASLQVLLQNSTTKRSVSIMFSLTQLLLALSSAIIIYLQTSVFARLTSDPEYSKPPFDYHFPFYLGALLIFIGYLPTVFVEGDFENKVNPL